MKKIIRIVIVLFFVLIFQSAPVYAAQQKVAVKVADFPVTLNGVQVGESYFEWLSEYSISSSNTSGLREYSQYPLLVYKDITYVPMTWGYGNLLNLNISWSRKEGLAIDKGDPSQWKDFRHDDRNTKNSKNQTATIVDFEITVNGKIIDNSKEPYPLLFFRDIVYIPLTWNLAVTEFGWRYSYSDAEGLIIEADNAVYYWIYVFDHPTDPYRLDTVFYDSYIRDDLKIWITYRAEGHALQYGKMFISQGGKVTQVGDAELDRFGAHDSGEFTRFRVEGDWVYTWYSDYRQKDISKRTLVPARVNIQTREFEIVE